jgi:hypothetical protein
VKRASELSVLEEGGGWESGASYGKMGRMKEEDGDGTEEREMSEHKKTGPETANEGHFQETKESEKEVNDSEKQLQGEKFDDKKPAKTLSEETPQTEPPSQPAKSHPEPPLSHEEEPISKDKPTEVESTEAKSGQKRKTPPDAPEHTTKKQKTTTGESTEKKKGDRPKKSDISKQRKPREKPAGATEAIASRTRSAAKRS